MTPIRVAFFGDMVGNYSRGVFRGASRYARMHPHWKLLPLSVTMPSLPATLASGGFDGVIAQIGYQADIAALRHWGRPIVNTSAKLDDAHFPKVIADDAAIGRLAAEHFIERGFRQAACAGQAEMHFSAERCAGFCLTMDKAGVSHSQLSISTWREGGVPSAAVAWLMDLPRPAAVFCTSDLIARKLLEACADRNVNVPGEIAILGVDNDELESAASPVDLSSIELDLGRIGYEAATLLDELIAGKRSPEAPVRIAPKGLIARTSSDAMVFADADVASALRFIRGRACTAIGASDVVAAVSLSRRNIEARFRRATGLTIYQEITRCRIAHAKQLLFESDWSIADIADACGYCFPKQLSIAFRRATGMAPRDYRAARRAR